MTTDLKTAARLLTALVVVALAVLPSFATGLPARAGDETTGVATSTAISCLPVGPDYLGAGHPSPYAIEMDFWLYWTGTPTSARLLAYEFNAGGTYGREIFVNGVKIGNATGTRGAETLCRGFEGREPLAWSIADPGILVQGKNKLRITLDSTLTDKSWGLSRAQVEVSGAAVDGRRYREVTIPSSYFNNWQGYANEGTWTHVLEPSGYNPAQPAPLLVAVHGFGSSGLDALRDFDDAADARGWLLAASDLHGETSNGFYDIDISSQMPRLRTGIRNMGARAAQWDVADTVAYMQAHYNVDPQRIYLVGHSMGGMTALLAGARWPQTFAAIVTDSGPTDLSAWEGETSEPDGQTKNPSINAAIRAETGKYSEPGHTVTFTQYRIPVNYPFEYERRSPLQVAANFKHLPLLILHPQSDQKVMTHHAEDLYLLTGQFAPEHVERVYFPGIHGDRIADFANYTLNWLGQFTRNPAQTPNDLSFATDWSGQHFWLDLMYSSSSLNEAHWVRVDRARFDVQGRTVALDIENIRPQTGDPDGLGVPQPSNLTVTLGVDLAKIGLPATGAYTIERFGKDDGSFSQTIVQASGGRVQAQVPQGAHSLRITAGDRPPVTQVLKLAQGVGGFTGWADTYLSNWAVDTNYVSSATLSLRTKSEAPAHSPVFRFDLAGKIPAGAKVRFASLSLQVSQAPARSLPVQVHLLNRTWIPAEATWNRASAAAPWAVPGAEGFPLDRAEVLLDRRAIHPSTAVANRYGLDVTAAVTVWLASPASNRGVIVRGDPLDGLAGNSNDGLSFHAGEAFDAAQKPFLAVAYTLEQDTPTPSPTPTATATATATPTSTATPTATLTPAAGSIVGSIYADDDRDGQRDLGESGLPGRLVQLLRNGELNANVTTLEDGSYSFADLSPGGYDVSAALPATYELTAGANPAQVLVQAGGVIVVDFPAALRLTPTATATLPIAAVHYVPLILR